MYRVLMNVSKISNATFSKCSARCLTSTSKLSIAVAGVKEEDDYKPADWNEAKPYNEIPRIKGPLGGLLNFFPGGKFYNVPLRTLSQMLNKELGDLVVLKGFFGRSDIVIAYNPKDFEHVYRLEGQVPHRREFETFKHFRKVLRSDIYGDNAGLLAEQQQKWRELRGKVNPVMMQPRIAKQYITPIEGIADEFIQKILKLRDSNNELPSNFVEEMNKWALESIACIALDSRLGCLKDDDIPNAESKKMIQSVHDFFECSYKLEILPSVWRYIGTPTYYRLMNAMETMTNISLKKVDEAMERLKNNPEEKSDREASVLEKLLKIDRNVAIVMSMDMLLAGVDTTSYASSILLYFLAINPRVQEKLREEIKTILPEKDSKLSAYSLDHVPYLRACMKESNRMLPVAGGVVRRTPVDIVLSGYQIQKGTDILMSHAVATMQASHYPNPEKFIPERWLGNQDITECPSAKTAHPFVHMPFGFGPRSCIGKRFADLEMKTFIVKLLRNYKAEWNHGEFKVTSFLLTTPVSPLKFKITEI